MYEGAQLDRVRSSGGKYVKVAAVNYGHTMSQLAALPFKLLYTTMNDPTMPERALLTLRRAEEAELNDFPDDLEHQPNIHWIQKVFPVSELKISYLPIAYNRGTRLPRVKDNIPLRYLGWAP